MIESIASGCMQWSWVLSPLDGMSSLIMIWIYYSEAEEYTQCFNIPFSHIYNVATSRPQLGLRVFLKILSQSSPTYTNCHFFKSSSPVCTLSVSHSVAKEFYIHWNALSYNLKRKYNRYLICYREGKEGKYRTIYDMTW